MPKAAWGWVSCRNLADYGHWFQLDTSRLREKSRIFQAKCEIASRKKQEKSENISKPYTLPVLVSLLITEVVGLNVDQISLTSFDPDSDVVIFDAKSALVYSVTVFYLSNCRHILCVATLEGEIQGRFLTKDHKGINKQHHRPTDYLFARAHHTKSVKELCQCFKIFTKFPIKMALLTTSNKY